MDSCLLKVLGSWSFRKLGKESMMATLARSSVNTFDVTEILGVAHKILRSNHDPELASKIMVLEGTWN